MRLPIRTTALLAACTLVASGCGLLGRPSVSSQEDVLAAFGELVDAGFRTRISADVELVEQELRTAFANNPGSLEAFTDSFDTEGGDADEAIAEIEEASAMLDRHALLVEIGEDRSVRYAVESDGTVWADLRVLGPTPEEVEAGSMPVTLQLAADIPFAAGVFDAEAPDTQELLDGVAMMLEGSEGGDSMVQVLSALFGGDLIEVSGDIAEVGESIMGDLGMTDEDLAGATDPFGLGELDLDPRAFIDTAFTFSGFRVEDGLTVVDVTVNVRDGATLLADTLEQVADAEGAPVTAEDVEELRRQIPELPETLTNIATLRLDGNGSLNQVRVDVVDLALQVAAAEDTQDEDLALMTALAADLDETGLFLVVDVDGVGSTPTVMGTAAASTDFETLVGLAFATFFGGMSAEMGFTTDELAVGGDEITLPDLDDMLDDQFLVTPLLVTDLAVGDCFDDELRYGGSGVAGTVSCDELHNYEVYAAISLTGPYDLAAFTETLSSECQDAFATFVGVDYFESELFYEVLPPTEDEYAQGVTDGLCFISSFEGETSSVAGAGR